MRYVNKVSQIYDTEARQKGRDKMRLRKATEDINKEDVLFMAAAADALAHPARIEMFRFIMKCNRERIDVCNGDLVEAFDYAQATVSQHMKTLTRSGLVDIKKKDKFSYYYANIGSYSKFLDIARRFE